MSESPFFVLPNGDQIAKAIDILEKSELDFISKAKAIGLDPESDFQFAILDNTDLSDCDLRNVNFTGASLRGVTRNENTVFDDTTILDGADTEGSFFEEEDMSDRQSLEPSYLNDHWTEQVIWLDRFQFGAATPNHEEASRILDTFLRSGDAFVRRTALGALRKTMKTEKLIQLIERVVFDSVDRTVLAPSLDLLRDLCKEQPEQVRKMVVGQLQGPWAAEAATFLVAVSATSQIRYLSALMSRHSSHTVRRRFISALAAKEGLVTIEITRNPETGDVYDFNNLIPAFALDFVSKSVENRRKRFVYSGTDTAPSPTDLAMLKHYQGNRAEIRSRMQRDLARFSIKYRLGWHFMDRSGFYAGYSFVGDLLAGESESR